MKKMMFYHIEASVHIAIHVSRLSHVQKTVELEITY